MRRRIRSGIAATALLAASGALAQSDRSVLPIAPPPFSGHIAPSVLDSRPDFRRPVQAPAGAPNVLLFMSDDVGFAMASTFGGPVPTPNMDRLAAAGERYNRFHTTGICSPTRAALLTGRNHHEAGVGFLSDTPMGYPGYGGGILPETATIARVLRGNGYNTAMVGKHHDVPGGQDSAAGPFDSWPTGLGFEHFFGFIAGDSDQYNPNLFRGTDRTDPDEGHDRMLEERLADDVISWIHNQKTAAPERPFFVYYAPGSTHAPHQAPAELIARFRGRFDQGWDRMREETFARQLRLGIVPRGTRLTPRPSEIPAWDTLTPNERAFAARTMEVAAAQLAYQDQQFGRVLDELQRMGQLRNTLIAVIQGDNGASGEGGVEGTTNELEHINGLVERPEWRTGLNRLGGPLTYENYPVGWAWAMNTPLRWTKQYASMLGGIRNGMILSWQGHVAHPGSICQQFGHVVDLAPTIYAAAGVPMPTRVDGTDQRPLDGESLLPSLQRCDPDHPRTQYFEITGKLGLYHDGWFASRDTPRTPWQVTPIGGRRAAEPWELYDLRHDFSQWNDVAAEHPDVMQQMIAIWQQQAERNNVLPLEESFGRGRQMAPISLRRVYEFWGTDTSIPATRDPLWVGRSWTLDAELRLARPDASGVVMAVGSHFGGFSLFLDHGRPTFVYARSADPTQTYRIAATQSLSVGTHLRLRFVSQGPGRPGAVTILADNKVIAGGPIPETFLIPAGLTETLDIGRDLGVTVTDYPTHRGMIEGDVPHLTITFDH